MQYLDFLRHYFVNTRYIFNIIAFLSSKNQIFKIIIAYVILLFIFLEVKELLESF